MHCRDEMKPEILLIFNLFRKIIFFWFDGSLIFVLFFYYGCCISVFLLFFPWQFQVLIFNLCGKIHFQILYSLALPWWNETWNFLFLYLICLGRFFSWFDGSFILFFYYGFCVAVFLLFFPWQYVSRFDIWAGRFIFRFYRRTFSMFLNVI